MPSQPSERRSLAGPPLPQSLRDHIPAQIVRLDRALAVLGAMVASKLDASGLVRRRLESEATTLRAQVAQVWLGWRCLPTVHCHSLTCRCGWVLRIGGVISVACDGRYRVGTAQGTSLRAATYTCHPSRCNRHGSSPSASSEGWTLLCDHCMDCWQRPSHPFLLWGWPGGVGQRARCTGLSSGLHP